MVEFEPKVSRVVLIGGGGMARDVVELCKSLNFEVFVVTSARHAKEHDGDCSFERFLLTFGIQFKVLEIFDNADFIEAIGNKDETLFLSLGAPWIFKANTLSECFNNRLLNLHGTRLPQNRGGASFSWQILMGNKFGFCQLHYVDAGVDTGSVVAFEEFLYPSYCRVPLDYELFYRKKNKIFLAQILKSMKRGNFKPCPQPQFGYLSTYWPRLDTNTNGWIDWKLDATLLERFVCAFGSPYGGAKTTINGHTVSLSDVLLDFSDGIFHPHQFGLVFRKSRSWLCVAVNGGTLIVQKAHLDDGESCLDRIKVGDRFFTPASILQSSLSRVSFDGSGLVS